MSAGPCPVCQSMADLIAEGRLHGRTTVVCEGCGRFEVTRTVQELLLPKMDGDRKLRLRYWLRRAQGGARSAAVA